jgi:hypothetical protein
MAADPYDKPPTHIDAIREAWHEFKEGVGFKAFCLGPECADDGPGLPTPIAWLCAPWTPLAYRFTPYNLERIFRPKKAERRQRVHDLCEYVFVCGASEMTDERWAEADALVAEFGIPFPPRDWGPMSVCETVGAIMGYSREEVADIVAKPPRTPQTVS